LRESQTGEIVASHSSGCVLQSLKWNNFSGKSIVLGIKEDMCVLKNFSYSI
jgi:hypothetical protein